MIDFGGALEHASEDALDEAITTYAEVDYAMRYVAVDRAIAHDDGPMHWYCSMAGCYNHNFYWYQEEQAAKFWLIAWDLDSAFNLDNVTTTLWFDWDDTSRGCRAVSKPPFSIPLLPPSCDPLIRAWAHQQERYLAETQAFLEGPFDAARVASKLDAWQAQIEPFVAEASQAHDDAPTPDAWRDATDALREAIATLRDRAEHRVARGAIEITDPRAERPMDAGQEDAARPDAATDDDAGE
jgi:hypothetical protein